MSLAGDGGINRLWKCDICGRKSFWNQSWTAYGSVLIEEERPQDMITVCSETCKAVLDQKLSSGEISPPVISRNGRLLKPRKGY